MPADQRSRAEKGVIPQGKPSAATLPGRDAETAQRLHHQHHKIAAGSRPARDCLGRGLRSLLVPGLIAEFGFDRVRHRLHDRKRARLFASEAARPCGHRSVRVRRLRPRETRKVGASSGA